MGLLRRLDVFTEPELRLKFLQARDSWFNGILKSIPKEDAYQHIIKVVEASRVHLFDIVTQYRAIFSDDDNRFGLGDPEVNEQAIFHGWILHKVNQFIAMVERDLQRGVGNNLEALLAQCMFFGQSFSRIGADFRNLLIPLFQKAALLQLEKDIRIANIRYDETLSCFSLMETQQLSSSATLLPETQDRTRPPLTLMEFAPLAHYMNGLVAAFNTLRQCCPVATLAGALRLLRQSVAKVISALLELHRLESSGFTAREAVAFQRMCSVVANDLLPHINKCLCFLYPLQQISLITGIPGNLLHRQLWSSTAVRQLAATMGSRKLTNEEEVFALTRVEQRVFMMHGARDINIICRAIYTKWQKCGQLNTEELLAPIQHLLPEKEEKVPDMDVRDPIMLSDRREEESEIPTTAEDADQTSDVEPLEPEPGTEYTTPLNKIPSEESTEVNYTLSADTAENTENTSIDNQSKSFTLEPLLTEESVPSSDSPSPSTQDPLIAEPTYTIS
ncbi:Conserved oligomeric Golgi complex subunit 8 [Chionoecetes opilio]|uniref:Conserved oligomeric Golgi complex subunit 8 n=1 Tax=Chionoecetes opilio TaxID=41210 RepID=A0A8J4XMD6_CHIOP|nr:Conserved oligomeric Golgi complex subunit 8 [Chionoecetes opilio]